MVLFTPTVKGATWTDIDLPYTIIQSGNYRITQPWTGNGTGLSVNASNVVVDGQNKLIQLMQTDGNYSVIIASGSSNVLLQNINETSADYGVYAEEGNFTTQDCTFTNNTSAGIFVFNVSDFTVQHSILSNNSNGFVSVQSKNFTVKNCTVNNNDEGMQIAFSNNFTIFNSIINSNTEYGLDVTDSANFTVQSSSLNGNNNGFYSTESDNFTIDNTNLTNSDTFGFVSIDGNFTLSNSNLNNNTCGFGALSNNFAIANCNINNNYVYGTLILQCNSTIKNTVAKNNSVYGLFTEMSNLTIANCNINNNTMGLLSAENGNFTLEDSIVSNNTFLGLEEYLGVNTLINNNTFSRNGLDPESNLGAFMAEDTNCTVTNNVFDSNFDSLLFGIFDGEMNNTLVYHNNYFVNDNFTFDFNYQLPSNFTNQQIYFYNNLVNDSAYVNPDSFGDNGGYVPPNTVFHLNTTQQTGTRTYSSGSRIGGNFWAYPNGTGFSQTGTDANHDGFTDAAFDLFGNETIYDYFPYSSSYVSNLTLTAGTNQTLVANQVSTVLTVQFKD